MYFRDNVVYETEKYAGALVFLDFEKAFDSIEWISVTSALDKSIV